MAAFNHPNSPIRVENLSMAYDSFLIMRDLNFSVKRGSIFVVMGGSGCGKSTLLKHLVGLKEPAKGRILYDDLDFTACDIEDRKTVLRRMGVLYQTGALWSALTLLENVSIPLKEFTSFSANEIDEIARLKLALVGLKGFEDHYPSQISGGMQKRAGLARAMALDPEFLFFDEPSAGLDPLSSRRLDDLILELRDSLGTTVVVVTHELDSIFKIADDSIFLDTQTKSVLDHGNPKQLRAESPHPAVRSFLTRGGDSEKEAHTI
ncbi:MAG: ATP-binding cassette domain-containing protein [Bradymonadales bacterium]|nr:MAG: ATP-binding cassette domain-containing protein [Bradymonadales bacterium]